MLFTAVKSAMSDHGNGMPQFTASLDLACSLELSFSFSASRNTMRDSKDLVALQNEHA
jgi:hypothetical protein